MPEKRNTNCFLRIHWRLSTILETSNKSVWSNVSWYVKVCIFWNCIQYIIHWDKTQILKKFPSEKINVTKNALFFLSRAPTHHIFNFNLRFLYELKHKVRLSNCVWDFPFSIRFRFYWSLYFCSTKCLDSSFKSKIIEKPHTILLPEVLKFNDICMSWSTLKMTWWQAFSIQNIRSFGNVSIVTF